MPWDGPDAASVGLLLARTGSTDIAEAHVALCARRAGQAVVATEGICAALRRNWVDRSVSGQDV